MDLIPITVILEPREMQMCADIGRERFASARAKRRDQGLGPGGIDSDIRGAQCEFAASIGLNLFWRPSVGDIHNKDAGDIVQVRSTVLPHGRLPIKPKADDADPYVLVFQDGTLHQLIGWLEAGIAKRIVPLTTKHGDPLHFVERRLLQDIRELKRRVHHGIALDCAEEMATLMRAEMKRGRASHGR